ncbi:MAG: helix-hairpin-helix domain-containing protein [Planctomycetes bacterium]|nr:helix-hairpin-helix domain-containing protein [Planctomycetota bacterium]
MSEPPPARPAARKPLVERTEQAVLVVLALAVVAGVAYRAASYWRLGAEPLEPIPPASLTYRLNVNAADWTTLALVPGLGKTLAERIVDERKVRGGRFESLDELTAVKGIGEKTLARLRPYLFIGEPDAPGEPVEMLEGP